MSLHVSPSSDNSQSRFDTELDTWDPSDTFGSNINFDYPPEELKSEHKQPRILPGFLAAEAIEYITVISKRYPLQARDYICHPMWVRFCDVWMDTGDFMKAMRAI